MIRGVSLFVSASIIAFSGGSALGATLVGSELTLGSEIQLSPTSQLFVTSFPVSRIVSESTVEFPNIQSLFDPTDGVPPGYFRVNTSIDAGADYLEIDFDNAGFSMFASGFKNSYVFTFSALIALQIQGVSINTQTTLGLTPERVTFDGSELFVNVQGLSFNPSTFVRLDLDVAVAPEPDPVSVPEPSPVFSLVGAMLAGTIFKGYSYFRKPKSKLI